MAKKTAAAIKKAKAAKLKTNRAKAAAWVSKLNEAQLGKLTALRPIIRDLQTCERVPKPEKTLVGDGGDGSPGFWKVTWK